MLTHLYLSAHLDDAVLSCGGLIHKQTQAGDRGVVLTVCAGDPPKGEFSLFAQELHQRWGLEPARAAAARRAEDLAALEVLGAEAVHLTIPDCIYRADQTGRPLYASEPAIFGTVHPAENALVRRIADKIAGLARTLGRCRVYAPLGVGHHVDHQLTRRAAEMAGGIHAYFEDYPYAAGKAAEEQLAALTRTPDGRDLAGEIVPLGEANVLAQTQAIARYGSQISSFWANTAAMEGALQAFALQVGGGKPGGKLWRIR